MKAVIQRVSKSDVTVDGEITGKIGQGFMILLGVAQEDTEDEAEKLAAKISKMRVFEDDEGKMNLSIKDIGGEVLTISQFTLLADTRKGNRPSFIYAGKPEKAEPLYNIFCKNLEKLGIHVEKGVFGAHMDVSLINDGPVTIILES